MERIIQKLIYAWRTAKKISDGMEDTFGVTVDAMYDIHGNILDALREYVFEQGDLEDSEVFHMLQSQKKADYVADALCIKHEVKMLENSGIQPIQPAPKFFTDEQIERMQQVFGGYVHDAK